jgi:N-acetyl sugar amidotransferase
MKWCQSCVLPDSRPNLVINDDGICNACKSSGKRKEIDWAERRASLDKLVAQAKERACTYDCVIPVSGGKDSTWQVVQALELGLKPLCVTWRPIARTELGQRNLENLISLGVDHIDFSINPAVEGRFMLEAFKRFGAIGIPMHLAIFNIPLNVAARYEIPLVLWGENSAAEYGGTQNEADNYRLDGNWIRKFGVSHGTAAEDWVSENLSLKDLSPYRGPDPDVLEKQGVDVIFLGHFIPWDVETSVKVARAHGFQEDTRPRTGTYKYADLDDDFISLHHWMKWYKFGFTRSFDNLSLEIRRGRLQREEAIEFIRKEGASIPEEDIAQFCHLVHISKDDFFAIAEKFRNTEIWQQDSSDRWSIPNFLIPGWSWV